ncbi:MAG: sarcosine oxidase subunit gamma family protein [Caulobacteraceae bacterium]
MADLNIIERSRLGLATVMVRHGVDAEAVGRALGIDMPTGPTLAGGGGFRLLGYGPGVWLVMADAPTEAWCDLLATSLQDKASVSDQSSAYVVFEVKGAHARELLQRGAFIDLDTDVFGPGGAAVTVIAHIGVILWRPLVGDGFEVACFRSYADSFRDWLDAAAASL